MQQNSRGAETAPIWVTRWKTWPLPHKEPSQVGIPSPSPHGALEEGHQDGWVRSLMVPEGPLLCTEAIPFWAEA